MTDHTITRTHRWTVSLIIAWIVVTPACADSPIRPGDHVAIVGNTFADQLKIHGYLETMLLHRWPDNPVSIRNLGWGGDMLHARDRPTNFPTEDATLQSHQTDVIIACFGMGESFAGEEGLSEFRDQLIAFIKSFEGKKYNDESEVRLVLVSPIANEPLGKITPRHEQRDRELFAYSQAMREVALDSQIPFVDLYQPSRYLMNERIGGNFTTNGIHLNAYGYWAMSHNLLRDLTQDASVTKQTPWSIMVDASDLSTNSRGVEVSDMTQIDDSLSFRATEIAPPTIPPPTTEDLPQQLEHLRDSMTITNLPTGSYELTIDGASVAIATDKQWLDGVAIDASPAHQAVQRVRMAVNDKNLQFNYSWRALNQVHIVGERKRSPSGRALPAEVVAFGELAKERDAALSQGIEVKTRDWRLERVSP